MNIAVCKHIRLMSRDMVIRIAQCTRHIALPISWTLVGEYLIKFKFYPHFPHRRHTIAHSDDQNKFVIYLTDLY